MGNMINKIKRKIHHILLIPRRIYKKKQRMRLKNTTPSIISNNCIAGVILSDLHCAFNTPTINLYMDNHDYLTFLENIREYLALEVVQVEDPSKSFPVGVLYGSAGEVQLYFMHYDSFETAQQKWLERSQRVDFDNLYVMMDAHPGTPLEIINRFDRLDFSNKVILSDRDQPGISSNFKMSFYDPSFLPGKILTYKTRFGMKRYLDEFDYVSFLNCS